MKPTLVILAAGMGSRYGGLKQIDTVGNNGECIIDFTIYDAIQAGFEKLVLICEHYRVSSDYLLGLKDEIDVIIDRELPEYRCFLR